MAEQLEFFHMWFMLTCDGVLADCLTLAIQLAQDMPHCSVDSVKTGFSDEVSIVIDCAVEALEQLKVPPDG